jgi:hypothetical protein
MFVFPDERFTKCPPDDAETMEPGSKVSKTKTKGAGVPRSLPLAMRPVQKKRSAFPAERFCVEQTMR